MAKTVKYELGVSGYGDMGYDGPWYSFEGSIEDFKRWHESVDLIILGPPDLGGCIYCACTLDGESISVEEILKM